MNIFKTLMTARIYGWTVASVQALNIIDIVFADDKSVRDAWKDLYEKYSIQNPNEVQKKAIETARCKLLETMANSLGDPTNLGIIRSPVLQADSLPTELSEKP